MAYALHTVATQQRARELEIAGYSRREIARMLGTSNSTISLWLDAEEAERHRDRVLRYKAGKRVEAKEREQIRRVRALHAAGLSHTNVGRVLEVDYGGEWSRDRIATVLREGRIPRRYRKAVA